MFRCSLPLLAALLASGCSERTTPPAASPQPAAPQASAAPRPAPAEVVDEEAYALFREKNVDGAFVLLDLTTRGLVVVNPTQAATGYLPASTFKIPNTLIGLETGVIPDESFSLPWDGKVRGFPGPDGKINPIPEWNRDHDLPSAMKHSAVWFYQEVARRIGPERMARHLDAFAYGNRDMSAGIDMFWLEGKMRITPREQVEFLRKLHEGELPVKPAHAEIVKKIIVRESKDGITLRGKTGLTQQDDRSVGWLVGSVEREGGGTSVYATIVLAPRADIDRIIPIRMELTTALLRRRGLPLDGG